MMQRCICCEPAAGKYQYPVAELFCFLKDVSGEQDRRIRRNSPDEVADSILLVWIQTISRFVKDERRRAVQNRLCKPGALTPTFGK